MAAGVVSGKMLEEERNKLLRRVDWRFLLPDPNPQRTICFAAGSLFESVRSISGTVLDSRSGREARDCDVAVAVDPDRSTLALAHGALRPGGFLYSECRGTLRRTSANMARRMESAGFETPELYWPYPSPSHRNPEAWLPVRGRSALRYYFVGNRGRSRTPLRRAGRKMLRMASATAPRLGMARPLCFLARKPAAAREERPPTSVLDALVAGRWETWGLGPAPKSVSWLLLTGGLRSDSKVVALGFADSKPSPAVALKMPRTPDAASAIDKEASVLRALAERLADFGPQGIPRFLFLEELGSVPVLGETAMTGVPLLSAWTADNYQVLALKASAWLADLAGRGPFAPPDKWWNRLVAPVLAEFADRFGPALDSRLLRESEELLRTLPPLPLVCEQRDFSPWNVHLTPSGDLAVVDWESAELEGLPALDLIYFLTYLGFSLDSARRTGRYRESYRNLIDRSTPRGALAARCLATYCRKLGLDSAVLRPLRLLTWLLHSRSEYRRLLADFGPVPGSETLRSAVCVQLWQEELRHVRDD
jgi:hypothetical protein